MATRSSRKSTSAAAKDGGAQGDGKPRLLSGGNPQIAKADGDAPVQAYIAAMPGWKSDVGRRLDALIVRAVPGVRKAVRWNSPFYGVVGQGWFASYHVFTRYIKVTFLNGAQLDPEPPGAGKDPDARWVDIYEGELDEAQMEEPGCGSRPPCPAGTASSTSRTEMPADNRQPRRRKRCRATPKRSRNICLSWTRAGARRSPPYGR